MLTPKFRLSPVPSGLASASKLAASHFQKQKQYLNIFKLLLGNSCFWNLYSALTKNTLSFFHPSNSEFLDSKHYLGNNNDLINVITAFLGGINASYGTQIKEKMCSTYMTFKIFCHRKHFNKIKMIVREDNVVQWWSICKIKDGWTYIQDEYLLAKRQKWWHSV